MSPAAPPPPQASPEPKDEVSDTVTGKFKAFRRADRFYTAVVALLALLASLGSIFGTYRLFLGDAKAQTKDQVDAGLERQQIQINALKDGEKVTKENQQIVLVEVHELRKDLQELYKANRYDRPSPRLEQPLAPLPALKTIDGGH